MTEFPRESAFERGKHKFTPSKELGGTAAEPQMRLDFARQAQDDSVARARRGLDDLWADLGEMEHTAEDEGVREMVSGIRRTVAEIIDDLN